jgi:YidC/Oxa1 family membrane protein insertase
MAAAFDVLLKGIGFILAFLYDVVQNYGLAIILLTIVIRVILLPLTVKQIRSMTEMQKIQPLVKELQKKHKGDRQKMNEELMKVYKEHRVNPLGGCLPLVMQLPVFFALYAVLRAAHPAVALPPDFRAEAVPKTAVCAPATPPRVSGEGAEQINCVNGIEETYDVEGWADAKTGKEIAAPPEMFRCSPVDVTSPGRFDEDHFLCRSPLGSGHLPKDSKLYRVVVEQGTGFAGMDLACSPSQAASGTGIRQCGHSERKAGGAPLVAYYGLVVLMVGTTWYQQKQMQQMSGQSNPQMQMMSRIMPVFLGFISLSIPAGVLLYWVTTNVWQVGQQRVMMRIRNASGDGQKPGPSKAKDVPAKELRTPQPPRPAGKGGSGRSGGGNRKKRRKR